MITEDNTSFQMSSSMLLSTSSSSNEHASCPFCYELFEFERLVLIHVICKHATEYCQLRMSTADELCSKIPGARGSTVEEKMRQKENENNSKQKEIQSLPPIAQTLIDDNEKNNPQAPISNTTTLENALQNVCAALVPPDENPYQKLFDDLNLDLNENEMSENSSPCWANSNPQSVETLPSYNNGSVSESKTTHVNNNNNMVVNVVDQVVSNVSQRFPAQIIPAPVVLPQLLASRPPPLPVFCPPTNNGYVAPPQSSFATSSPIIAPAGNTSNKRPQSFNGSTDTTPRNNNKRPKSNDIVLINDDRLVDCYGACPKLRYRQVVVCLLCQRRFPTAEEVFHHEMQKHADLNRFFCPIYPRDRNVCQIDIVYSSMNEVHQHLVSFHRPPWQMQCLWCQDMTSSYLQCAQHMENEYRNRRLMQIRMTLRDEITVKCKKCKQKFDTKREWYEHRANACYRNEPEAQKNREMAAAESQATPYVKRNGCVHNRQICAYYPTCGYFACKYAHPVCWQELRCCAPSCIDDHAARKKSCNFCVPLQQPAATNSSSLMQI